MIRRSLLLIITILCLGQVAGAKTSLADSLMMRLDEVLANRHVYLFEKESRIEELESRLHSANTDHERFHALGNLFDEYQTFNTDSAFNICRRQESIGRQIGDSVLILNAMLNRANILNATGMYHETIALMDSVRLEELPPYIHPYYYHIKRTLYGRLADYAAFAPEKRQYSKLTDAYRDSLMAVNPPNSLVHELILADQLNERGRAAEAVEVLHNFISANNLSEHEKAICAWTFSEAYKHLGDNEKRKEQLLVSAIADMKSSVREYVSLRELALQLYREGDLKRAYEYMSIAVDDATKCNARQRIIELSSVASMINGIYFETVTEQKRDLERTIFIIMVLVVALIVLMFFMRKQIEKLANARREIEKSYEELNRINGELKQYNDKLCEANTTIAEISELKEVYIGRYMDQCLIYIEKLDAYRKAVGKLVNSGKSEDIKALVKSSGQIDAEFKAFYDQFDKTFLNIFPTFVEDFNNLLLPEESILPKKKGCLTSELRIFALIRLGISDSESIAKFLRYSLTTIYNYRTKVRNKARGDRNKLEEELMKIGRAQARIAGNGIADLPESSN